MKKISEREFHYIKRLSENYVGLTAEKTIKVVSCDTGEEVFVSDKLSNMCGATYNEKTKKLLAYNTSGYAYLYQLSDGKRLLPKSQMYGRSRLYGKRIFAGIHLIGKEYID